MKRQTGGFTIVELLIVIVVIAVLAAITIVAYNGIQDRARSSAAASSSSQASKKIKVWQVDNELTTPTCTQFYTLVTNTATGAPTGTCSFDYKDTNYQYTAGSTGAFCVTTTVVNKSYKVSESTTPQTGGCSGHGQGGVDAITNYARDPNAASSTANFATMGSTPPTFSPSIASDRAHNGASSYKQAITGSGGAASKGLTANSPRFNAGEILSWSFWIYSTRAGNINTYAEGSKVSDGTYTGCGGNPGSYSVQANTWVKVSASCSVPVDTYVQGAGGYNLTVQAGDTVWFDEYMITRGSTQYNYADGNSADWIWNGTANNATSTGPPV